MFSLQNNKDILFVCTGNAGRSQIAEAIFRCKHGNSYNVQSAGCDPWNELHPVGRAMMIEHGYSMEGHTPKHIRSIDFTNIDIVVTIGAPAEREIRKFIKDKIHIHWNLGDPAKADDTVDSRMVFENTKEFIENKIAILEKTLSSNYRTNASYWQPGIASAVFKGDNINSAFSPIKHIPMLAKKGYKVLELTSYIPKRDFIWRNDNKVKELISVCEDNGITIWSAHPPENECLLGDDPVARHHNLEMLRSFADFCNRIGAAYMPIHLWSTTRTLNEAKSDHFLEFLLSELESICHDSNVTLCLETVRSNISKVSNFELLKIVKLRSSQLGLLVDSGHSQISGDLNEIILRSIGFLKSLHLHDNDGTNDLHQVPGTGVIDWALLVKNLKTANYAGPIIYEIDFISQENLDSALDATMANYKNYFEYE